MFPITMPPLRLARGHPARRNVEPQKQELPNAPKVQPQREVINIEFREKIRMLSQGMTNQFGQQRGARQEGANTLRIREFLSMNPPSFTDSSITDYLENLTEELKKMFEVMHFVDAERLELVAYQLKGISRTLFD